MHYKPSGVYLFKDVRRVFRRSDGGWICGRRHGSLAGCRWQYIDESSRVVVALQRVGAHEAGRFEDGDAAAALAGHAVAAVPVGQRSIECAMAIDG